MASSLLMVLQFIVLAISATSVAVVEEPTKLTLKNAYASITFDKDRVSGLAHAQIDTIGLRVLDQQNLIRSGFVQRSESIIKGASRDE